MTEKKIILFDFDGVLVNTLDMCFSITKEINPDVSLQEYKDLFRGNIGDAITTKKIHHHERFFDRYDAMARSISIQQKLQDVVRELSQKFVLCIVSSTDTSSIRKILVKEGVDGYFEKILGIDVEHSKSGKISTILREYGAEATDAVFVTDTLGDIVEAHAVHVPSIAVTWGFHDKAMLAKGNPAAIVDAPDDLVGAIEEILGDQ